MDIEQIQEAVDELYEKIAEGMERFSKEAISNAGLDNRAISTHCYFSKDGILIPTEQVRSAEYYGGLEYVGGDYKIDIGAGRFYSAKSERIMEIIERIIPEEMDEEDAP